MSKVFQALLNNYKRLKSLRENDGVSAYRLYDWDLEDHPIFVDRYNDQFVISDRSAGENKVQQLVEQLEKLMLEQENLSPLTIHTKKRRVTRPDNQYQRLAKQQERLLVQEGPLKFLVNLKDYLDTGLFLDHRPLREWLRKLPSGKKVLNLFAYTGSLSVAAAKSGAWVTSLDLSKNYLDWAQDNFRANDLNPAQHRFFRQDALAYLKGPVVDQYDLVILDPPTFSKSEKMKSDLDIQRDHVQLIQACIDRLKPEGTLYFSTNHKGFRINPEIFKSFLGQDITGDSIPPDFSRKDIHSCYKIQPRKK